MRAVVPWVSAGVFLLFMMGACSAEAQQSEPSGTSTSEPAQATTSITSAADAAPVQSPEDLLAEDMGARFPLPELLPGGPFVVGPIEAAQGSQDYLDAQHFYESEPCGGPILEDALPLGPQLRVKYRSDTFFNVEVVVARSSPLDLSIILEQWEVMARHCAGGPEWASSVFVPVADGIAEVATLKTPPSAEPGVEMEPIEIVRWFGRRGDLLYFIGAGGREPVDTVELLTALIPPT